MVEFEFNSHVTGVPPLRMSSAHLPRIGEEIDIQIGHLCSDNAEPPFSGWIVTSISHLFYIEDDGTISTGDIMVFCEPHGWGYDAFDSKRKEQPPSYVAWEKNFTEFTDALNDVLAQHGGR